MEILSKYFNRSYVISALLPTTVFVLTLSVLFPFSPIQLLTTPMTQITNLLLVEMIFPLFIIFWLSFLIFNNQSKVLVFFSGYHLPVFIKNILIHRQKKWLDNRTKHLQLLQKLKQDEDPFKNVDQYSSVYERARGEIARIEATVPIHSEYLAPTRLGSIFMSASAYAYERYGMEGNVVFPRLYKVIPKEYKDQMEGVNDQLNLMLNSAYFLFLLSSFSLLAFVAQMAIEILDVAQLSGIITFLSFQPTTYFSIGLLGIVGTYLVYFLSFNAAEDYSRLIRSACDFYRFKLLEMLQISLPPNSREEKRIWVKLSEFFLTSGQLGTLPLEFSYHIDTKLGEASNDKIYINLNSEGNAQPNQSQTIKPEFNFPITIDVGSFLEKMFTATEKPRRSTRKRKSNIKTKVAKPKNQNKQRNKNN